VITNPKRITKKTTQQRRSIYEKRERKKGRRLYRPLYKMLRWYFNTMYDDSIR
jgi:hypothetical protein